jgi:quinolinate synthase
MSDNVASAAPNTEFVRPCNLCPHMKRITLAGIHDSLVTMQHEVTVPEDVRVRAEQAINRMLALPKTAKPLDFQVGRPAADVEMFA